MFRRDYLQRQIALLAEALARIAGSRQRNDFDAAEREIADAYRGLNLDPSFLRLDPQSLILLVGDPERVRMLAKLLEEDAALCEARSDPTQARHKRKLAAALETWAASRAG